MRVPAKIRSANRKLTREKPPVWPDTAGPIKIKPGKIADACAEIWRGVVSAESPDAGGISTSQHLLVLCVHFSSIKLQFISLFSTCKELQDIQQYTRITHESSVTFLLDYNATKRMQRRKHAHGHKMADKVLERYQEETCAGWWWAWKSSKAGRFC